MYDKIVRLVATVLLGLATSQALAQSKPTIELAEREKQKRPRVWEPLVGVNSADLAWQGAMPLTSDGLSWPDGRQAIVTFWAPINREAVIRCVDYFDSNMVSSGGGCYAAHEAN